MLLSLVIPVYNEEEVLPALLDTLRAVVAKIDCDHEIIFVNDGSKDATRQILSRACAEDRRVKLLDFCRNFGHQMAITAGMDFASGDAVVVMDADLQDPPEILVDMVALYRQGYDVVSAQRTTRKKDTWFKRNTAAFFYWLMRTMVDQRLVSQVGDFRLFSRAAITAIRGFREQHRFMRGLVAWLGLKEAIVPFERQARVAGSTKYGTLKMIRFAWTAISSFSGMPLRLAVSLGMTLTTCGLFYMAYVIYASLILHETARGWASLVAIQITFSGAILLALGVVGDYIARIYEEIKGRPLYVLNDTLNIDVGHQQVPRAIVLKDAQARAERWSVAAR
jgi:dolichol-phosphate mannosyltransferase